MSNVTITSDIVDGSVVSSNVVQGNQITGGVTSGGIGLTGDTGSQGVQGSQGNQGTSVTGAQGNQGNTGSAGSQGNQGDIGNQGNTGVTGATGSTGAQGNQGNQGNQSSVAGVQGNQGDIGNQGAQGFQGNQSDVAGAQGFQGSTGAGVQGNQGNVGVQGNQGNQGIQGTNGTIGVDGAQGAQGNQGFQGNQSSIAGSQGFQGNQGSQGNQGNDGAGKATFTKVVAASGGDYTTVSAAIAAASAGWIIRVMPGTYTEAGWTSALTNISIVGENWAGTVLNFTTNSVTHSGANFTVKGVQMNFTTGVLTTNGADDIFENMYFGKTGANAGWAASGANLRVNNSKIISTYNTPAAGLKTVNFSGTNPDITNNYIETKNVNSTTSGNDSAVSISGSAIGANIVGNYINGTSTSGAGNLFNAGYGNIIANWIVLAAGATGKAFILDNPGGVANNSIKTTDGTAIYIYCNNFMATGNYLESKNGILVDVGVTYGTFSTNQFRTGTASGTFISINASGANNIAVVGNQFEGTSTTVGVLIHATAKYTTIVGNNFLKSMTTPITDNSKLTTIKDNTGTNPTLNKEFVYCKNTSGATVAVGDIVTWKAVAAGNEITTTTTIGDSLVYGVSEESIANNASGFVQVSGKTVDLKVNGVANIAVGDFITTFTTVGIGSKAVATNTVIALALEAYAGADSNGVIDALIVPPRLI